MSEIQWRLSIKTMTKPELIQEVLFLRRTLLIFKEHKTSLARDKNGLITNASFKKQILNCVKAALR